MTVTLVALSSTACLVPALWLRFPSTSMLDPVVSLVCSKNQKREKR